MILVTLCINFFTTVFVIVHFNKFFLEYNFVLIITNSARNRLVYQCCRSQHDKISCSLLIGDNMKIAKVVGLVATVA